MPEIGILRTLITKWNKLKEVQKVWSSSERISSLALIILLFEPYLNQKNCQTELMLFPVLTIFFFVISEIGQDLV